jgi:glycosyltransferase involved in cell wall biosynthesis
MDQGVPVHRMFFLKPKLHDLRSGRLDLYAASLALYPAALAELGRLFRAFRPDVVNLHFPDAQVPFMLRMKKWFSFRLVASLHGHDVERFFEAAPGKDCDRSGKARRQLVTLLREADAVTACSEQVLERAGQLELSVARKGCAIYNGVDAERFRKWDPFPWPRPYLLACGRLARVKGFDLLLDAYARLPSSCQWPDILLAGDGEERQALAQRARQLGIEAKVHFLGRVSPAEVVRLLQGCRLVAIPSRAEALGIVMLEALAAGKKVLATRVGGMAEFLSRYAGVESAGQTVRLVEPSMDGLASGLRDWLKDQQHGNELAVENNALHEFSWPRVARRYESVLRGETARYEHRQEPLISESRESAIPATGR